MDSESYMSIVEPRKTPLGDRIQYIETLDKIEYVETVEEDIEPSNKGIFEWIKNKKVIILNVIIFILFTGYFGWATFFFFDQSDHGFDQLNATTCSGYGFLLILYVFYLFGCCYNYLLKPVILPHLYKHIWLPIANLLGSIKYGNVVFYVSVLIAAIAYLVVDTNGNRKRLIPISGWALFLIVGFLMCSKKSAICWRTVIWGLILHFIVGLLTIRWATGRNILECIGNKVNYFLDYAFQGAAFTYGDDLVNKQAVFAFRALSTIYFLSFFINILYYYGIMQKIVGAIGNFFQWIMGTSICESVYSATNIFLGMSESPLVLGPYLRLLTDSELHTLMTAGFSTVAGSTMAAYISYGARPQDLITSCIMSIPAALAFSKLIYPQTEEIRVKKDTVHNIEIKFQSVMDAVTTGISNAIHIVHGIVASLIAFLAFIYWIDGVLAWMGGLVGHDDPKWSLDLFVGKIFLPISYLMGVPWDECEYVGTLIGIKTMVNEFVAFQRMHEMIEADQLSARTKVIATYAITGFANPGSIGIMTSVLSSLIPERSLTISRLVFRAFIGGELVCFMTGCVAGTLMPDV